MKADIRTTIAIIDDDLHIQDMLKTLLEREGYHVLQAYSGTEALYLLADERPDLILLDLMLPGLSGEEVLAKVQEIPVIVLSARADVEDKVSLLTDGAADYLTKPFDTRELLARISVQLRRPVSPDAPRFHFGPLTLDAASRTVTVSRDTSDTGATPSEPLPPTLSDGGAAPDPASPTSPGGGAAKTVRLTKTEYAILKLLMKNPDQVISKSVMLDRISEDTPDCTDSSLKQHVSNLRKKLREACGRDFIESVWGIGFKLTES